ncbi:sodium-dependent glucose transporter 1A [Lingula anatina]|uniref:Sodium-dependent glucose transporter 1A n=1 Tax=Lingula anatina TaxID=7574 RepID=A0A1S3IBI8_LINAN|nr:sodium-dependent glucose transporter 1A [Lingula anatina]|eukprot:XP_013395625.1 sodium-dependent glucose transporter 1A [Lingula anatina]
MGDEEKTNDARDTNRHGNSCCGSHRTFKTLLLCSAAVGLGLCVSVPGPTLIDLRKQVHASLETVSYIFSGRSAGYLLGSLVGGVLFDHTNHQLFLGLVMAAAGVATLLIPFATEISLLATSLAVHGIAMGCLDTGGNALCLSLWGKKSGPYMQSLHFAFGIGAVLAPAMVDPLLSGRKSSLPQNGTRYNTTFIDVVSLARWHPEGNETDTAHVVPYVSGRTYNISFDNMGDDGNEEDMWTESRIQYAFFAITTYLFICSIFFFVSCFQDSDSSTYKRQDQKRQSDCSDTALKTRSHSLRFKIPFLCLLIFFYLLIAGLDIAFGAFITTFAFDVLHWPKEKAANLSTVYWGSLAAVRGVSIIVSKFLNSSVMIISDLLLLITSLFAMVFLIEKFEFAMWIGTAMSGIGLASLYAAGISWAERYIHISGKISALFSIGGGAGKFVFPPLIGHFFHVNGMSFIYICLSSSVVNSVLYLALYLAARWRGERYLPVSQAAKATVPESTTTAAALI